MVFTIERIFLRVRENIGELISVIIYVVGSLFYHTNRIEPLNYLRMSGKYL